MSYPARAANTWIFACAVASLLACGEGAPPPASAPPEDETPAAHAPPAVASAPATLRASVVLEPPRVEIGDIFSVEVAVATPPGYRVEPPPVPKAIAGLAIVDAELPSVERTPSRWVHRQRFRARASATGPLLWPALELGVVTPDGERIVVVADERPFEVASLLAEHPERRGPFSFRSPRLEPAERGAWLPALLGSLGTLALVGLVAAVRRARRAPEAARGAAPGALAADAAAAAAALAAFARAEAAAADPVRAADLAQAALRAWAAERFRTPRLLTATTEELAHEAPPFLLTTRHAALVAALAGFDALRFPPQAANVESALHAALARARTLVGGATEPHP